ncbi:bifunctional riboflavin kinase/FAD synthetase [Hufsiella ginkgonis]|uniref:Riboflavin biosynthesis protein n=1 Tax=Hufsiella ginkgonis TaxID=2695274 RepID=A0A7K1Y241_9SPHI|nr:bifunctional riboflavin kinase/FAD synthetase [Hufsiella ginkgonis]MXV17147.1 bifunctional riboflavin kinase/FAD synthetase [Hufsiella ginkgonis]
MKIYHDIKEFSPVKNAVVTIGTFDGVHIGHQKIIDRLKEVARQIDGETVILTFFPHPRMILHPEDQSLKMLTTISEKSELLAQFGIDHLVITPFTRDFSNLSPREYVKQVLVQQIGTRRIVIGYDHRFGKDRSGGFTDLLCFGPEYGFEVEEIPEQDINDVAVSSTRIRNALFSGKVDAARDFLGYPFHLTGKVIKGDRLGRTLGYPTANLFVAESYKLIPGDGIYAVEAAIPASGEHPAVTYRGMGYIGNRPTINGMTRNIEVNLFDFNSDIYGQTIRVYFHKFIREDRKFEGLEGLILQLDEDKTAAQDFFSNR